MNDINQVEIKITVGIGSGIFTGMFCQFFFFFLPNAPADKQTQR